MKKPVKISAKTLHALIDAGGELVSAIERGDLSARDKYIANWNAATQSAMHEATPKPKATGK